MALFNLEEGYKERVYRLVMGRARKALPCLEKVALLLKNAAGKWRHPVQGHFQQEDYYKEGIRPSDCPHLDRSYDAATCPRQLQIVRSAWPNTKGSPQWQMQFTFDISNAPVSSNI